MRHLTALSHMCLKARDCMGKGAGETSAQALENSAHMDKVIRRLGALGLHRAFARWREFAQVRKCEGVYGEYDGASDDAPNMHD